MKLIEFFLISIISLLFLCTVTQGQNEEANLDTLKLVQLMFRHGDRVPEYPYPNDPFSDESNWPEGWAQLTDEGKRQEYQLGQYLRRRYGNFLDAKYVPNQIYAMASETDRTMMSGLLMLAGLYPTDNQTNWEPSVNWQPIPIRTVFKNDDNLIRFKRPCPKFDKLHEDYLNNDPEMKAINEKNKAQFESLSRNSGVNITTIDKIDKFYATMFVEEYKGKDIPEWGRPLKTDENFQYMYNLSYAVKTATTNLTRLRTGGLTKFLMDNVDERVRNESSKVKMVALSGHDITLIDALNTFGILDLQRPWYSSVLMIELHQNPTSGNYYIEFHYRNDTSREPYSLTMPGCEFQCPLDKVRNYTKPLIPEDWDEECKLGEPEPEEEGTSIFTYVLLGLGIAAVAIFLIGLVCMALQRKRRNQYYQRSDYQNF